MNYFTVLSCLLFIITFKAKSAHSLNPCNDWIPYKDQKCVKIISKLETEVEAEKNCSQLDSTSTLLTIHSEEEQDFLSNLLSNYSTIADNVWIGLKLKYRFEDKTYKWMDDKNIDYKNWAEGSPDPTEPGECVQMSLTKPTLGKWYDVSCGKQSLIVCEKMQKWTLDELLKALENVSNVVSELKNTNEKQIQTLNNELISLKESSIPVGYTYTQLPNGKSPQELWPTLTWTDISHSYAGLFFRVSGGQAAQWGSVQEANAPRLSSINGAFDNQIINKTLEVVNATLPIGAWSNWVYFGTARNGDWARYAKFYVNDDEIRPVNMAIRVWLRTK